MPRWSAEAQLDRRAAQWRGQLHAFEADPVVGESTMAAYRDAEAWVVKKHGK